MKIFKAVLFGSLYIVVVGLLVQLAYIFLAVGYIELAKNHLWMNDMGEYLRYLIGLPIFLLILFSGGYIAAGIAIKHVPITCFIVGVLTVGTMLASAIYDYDLTIMGYLFFSLALFAPMVGGWVWQRKNIGHSGVN